jgi:hypothetical protein
MTQDEFNAWIRARFNLWTKADVDAEIRKEREACAKLCEELPAPNVYSNSDKGMWDITSLECGDAIRARGNPQ